MPFVWNSQPRLGVGQCLGTPEPKPKAKYMTSHTSVLVVLGTGPILCSSHGNSSTFYFAQFDFFFFKV